MRITNTMLSNTIGHDLGRLRTRMYRSQMDLATGKQVHRPSDNPSGTVQVMKLQAALGRLEQHGQNIAQARAWLTDTEDALSQLFEVVERTRELAVTGATSVNSQATWEAQAHEVEVLRAVAVDTLNLAHNGYHVFGGFKAGHKPFVQQVDGEVIYTGDAGAISFEVGPDIDVQVNITDADLQAAGDLFIVMKELVDRLRSGDVQAITDRSIQDLERIIDNLGTLRTAVGARVKTLEYLEFRAVNTQVLLRTHLETIEGVDMETALLEFNQLQTAYETALRVGANILPSSLVNFLR